jgi:alkylated DNA nucleotide flippase Atl1
LRPDVSLIAAGPARGSARVDEWPEPSTAARRLADAIAAHRVVRRGLARAADLARAGRDRQPLTGLGRLDGQLLAWRRVIRRVRQAGAQPIIGCERALRVLLEETVAAGAPQRVPVLRVGAWRTAA